MADDVAVPADVRARRRMGPMDEVACLFFGRYTPSSGDAVTVSPELAKNPLVEFAAGGGDGADGCSFGRTVKLDESNVGVVTLTALARATIEMSVDAA